jgi:adenylate cyclase
VEKGLREKPDAAWGYRLLTVANYHAGRLEEARIALAKLVGAYPGLTIARVVESTPASHASYLAKLVEAFRALGLPE